MQEKIKKLDIGESLNVTGPIPKIRQFCSRLENKYTVVKIGIQHCLVVRIESEPLGMRMTVWNAIDELEPFGESIVHGNIAYTRTIVSQFNKDNNRNIVVSKRRTVAVLTEDIMERARITTDEFETFRTIQHARLETLRERIMDVMDEEII